MDISMDIHIYGKPEIRLL